jgi:mutator protein MutT
MRAGIDHIGVGVGAALFNEQGEVFMMRRGPLAKNEVGAWMFPGGTVEFGESLETAIKREVLEELNIAIIVTDQLPAADHILPAENQHWVTTIFMAENITDQPQIQEPEKCDMAEWFPLTQLPTPIAKASQKAIDYFIKTRTS